MTAKLAYHKKKMIEVSLKKQWISTLKDISALLAIWHSREILDKLGSSIEAV